MNGTTDYWAEHPDRMPLTMTDHLLFFIVGILTGGIGWLFWANYAAKGKRRPVTVENHEVLTPEIRGQ